MAHKDHSNTRFWARNAGGTWSTNSFDRKHGPHGALAYAGEGGIVTRELLPHEASEPDAAPHEGGEAGAATGATSGQPEGASEA